MSRYFIAALLATVILASALDACTLLPKEIRADDIRVRLKWKHQAQFAGMYAAAERGYYLQNGLNVTLLPFSYDNLPIKEVADGTVDFGVAGADEVMLARARGVPVKAVAVIYKINPACIYSLRQKGIVTPKDLEGKTIGIEQGIVYLYRSFVKKMSLNISGRDEKDIGYDDSEIVGGTVDAALGYINNEPEAAIEKGYDIDTMLLEDYGVRMYADVLIASDEMIMLHPERVRGYVEATLRGWQFAIENERAAINYTMIYAKDTTFEHQLKMLDTSVPLISTGDEPLGTMNYGKWEEGYNILRSQGLITEDMNVSDCFTDRFIPPLNQDRK